MKTPFFSIIIPTYNRAEFLNQALKSIFLQNFNDYEIIISDNASTDSTQDLVKGFKDKRIKYFRNQKNLGAEKNYQISFSYAKGEYIFTMGDDDLILFTNTLTVINKLLKKNKYGFIRLNLIEKLMDKDGLRKSIIFCEQDIEIGKGSSNKKIIDFFHEVAASHLAGLVIKNEKNISKKLTTCPNTPWISAILDATKKNGAYYLSSHYMIITWSQGEILNYYDVPKSRRLVFEDYTDYIFSLIPAKDLSLYKFSYLKNFIGLQPAIKLYSNNNNLIKFNNKLLELEPKLKYRLSFWIYFLTSLAIPNSIWRIVRKMQHKKNNNLPNIDNYRKITNSYNEFIKQYC